jgi:hypothetical protein
MGRDQKTRKALDEREAILNERDRILGEMPEGDMTDSGIALWFTKNRKSMLAGMFALATKSDSEKTRKEMLIRLNDMDMGRPGAKKRNDSDDITGVIIQQGTYGVH